MEERIDKYITGKMTPEEVLQFRIDLNTNEELQREYELAKEFADAVQRNAIKEGLAQQSLGVKQSKYTFRKFVYSLGVAASLALFANSGYNYVVSNNLKDISGNIYAQLEAPLSRSANDVDELLEGAYQQISAGELTQASSSLDAVETKIQDGLSAKYDDLDQEEYHHSILKIQQQDVDWYRVIILMKKGKVSKSKMMLKRIVKEGGIYAEEAQKLLDTQFTL